MRSFILSQCRDLRIGVTREDLGALHVLCPRPTLSEIPCLKVTHIETSRGEYH